jgi:ABC-three component (ABC-3C) system Middle Component 6
LLFPTKHTNFSQSLLGFGGYLLSILDKPVTADMLWNQYQLDFKNDLYLAKHSYDNLLLSLSFLYLIGAIEGNNGIIKKCNC